MKILGLETSCDETAAAVVEDGSRILSNVVVSQIDLFAAYGGVIPEVAARSHLEAILPVIDQALRDAHCTWDDIDAIAVTYAPGLLGSLLIGTLTARTLAILHHKPFYPVHHLKSHIYSNWLSPDNELQDGKEGAKGIFASISDLGENDLEEEKRVNEFSKRKEGKEGIFASISDLGSSRRIFQTTPTGSPRRGGSAGCPVYDAESSQVASENTFKPSFPLIALVISGGHTQILYMPAHNDFEIIGTTRDDAIGECFDKVAKILGLPYPGGPSITEAAQNGNPTKYHFPHPNIPDLDFSFSGLKTAVLREAQRIAGRDFRTPSHELKDLLTDQQKSDIAASFEHSATDILIEKLKKATKQHPDAQSIVIAGGVSANQLLRRKLSQPDSPLKKPTYFPAPTLSGDNGAMVATAAFYEIRSGVAPSDPYTLNIYPRTPIR